MVKELRKAIVVATALAAILAACAPAQVPTAEVQSLVATGVVQTVQAQNAMGTSVALTLTAQAPLPTATSTSAPAVPPADPALATATPFVVVPPVTGAIGGSTGSTQPLYACSWTEIKPKINQFKPGDPIDVVWIITNTGSKTWPSKKDLDYVSGTIMSSFMGEELPPLKSGDRTTISFDANAPTQPGFYEMRFKVEGGLCFPSLDIEVGKPPDP